MLKNIFITLVIFTLALNANDTEVNNETAEPGICEKIYDDCTDECEKSKDSDLTQCFEKCEVLYETCINKIDSENKDK